MINKRDPLFIYFASGNDVFLRYVLGLPTLLALGGLTTLVKGGFVPSEINRNFPLTLDPLGKEIPEGIVLEYITPTIPQGLPTNIKLSPSLLHYTSAEYRALNRSSLDTRKVLSFMIFFMN